MVKSRALWLGSSGSVVGSAAVWWRAGHCGGVLGSVVVTDKRR